MSTSAIARYHDALQDDAIAQASAEVFLRVLKDALFSGRGSADLLLPRVPLSALLPDPAWALAFDGDHQLVD